MCRYCLGMESARCAFVQVDEVRIQVIVAPGQDSSSESPRPVAQQQQQRHSQQNIAPRQPQKVPQQVLQHPPPRRCNGSASLGSGCRCCSCGDIWSRSWASARYRCCERVSERLEAQVSMPRLNSRAVGVRTYIAASDLTLRGLGRQPRVFEGLFGHAGVSIPRCVGRTALPIDSAVRSGSGIEDVACCVKRSFLGDSRVMLLDRYAKRGIQSRASKIKVTRRRVTRD